MAEPIAKPLPGEHAPYYARYIDLVPDGDLLTTLASQLNTTLALLAEVDEVASLKRYSPGKWSLREVLGHMIDTERIFAYRLLRIARGDQTPLPGFEQDDYVAEAHSDQRAWADLLEEFSAVRHSNLLMMRGIGESAWTKVGTASGNPLSARAAAWVIAGHERHHLAVIQQSYLA